MRNARKALMDNFYANAGQHDGKSLSRLLDEDPTVMERRQSAFKRLSLLKTARDEIDGVAWAR